MQQIVQYCQTQRSNEYTNSEYAVKLTCLFPKLSVVLDWLVPSLLKLKGRVHGQLLARALPEGLGPLGLSWVLLLLEVLCAFGTAEFEDLHGKETRVTNLLSILARNNEVSNSEPI